MPKVLKIGCTRIAGHPLPNQPTKRQKQAKRAAAREIAARVTFSPKKEVKPTNNVLKKRARKMRERPTYAEGEMCRRLSEAGIVFISQQVIGWYLADILIPSKMLIVELDGEQHYTEIGEAADFRRTKWLSQFGFQVLRIPNECVHSFDLADLAKFPDGSPIRVSRDAVADANKTRNRAMYHGPVQQDRYKAKRKQKARKPAWARVPKVNNRGLIVK